MVGDRKVCSPFLIIVTVKQFNQKDDNDFEALSVALGKLRENKTIPEYFIF